MCHSVEFLVQRVTERNEIKVKASKSSVVDLLGKFRFIEQYSIRKYRPQKQCHFLERLYRKIRVLSRLT